jgi:hypothetical protein
MGPASIAVVLHHHEIQTETGERKTGPSQDQQDREIAGLMLVVHTDETHRNKQQE